MSKVAIVYWSGTGNTEAMANAVADGVQGKGSEAVLIGPSELPSMTRSRSDAPQWAPSSSKKLNISPCGTM